MNRAHQIVGPVLLRRQMLQQTPFSVRCESLAVGESTSSVAPQLYQLGTLHGTHNLRAGYSFAHALPTSHTPAFVSELHGER
jgi:hypothetical protein